MSKKATKASNLGDLVRQKQRALFVGRSRESALLRRALHAESPRVVYVHGPGGIGKTTLTAELERACAEEGIAFYRLDGRDFDAQPRAMLAALIDSVQEADPMTRLGQGELVLCIDTFEALSAIDRWVRETFLPRMSSRALVVLASRNAPSAAWREHPGWGSLFVALPLASLDEGDALTYLEARGVGEVHRSGVASFARGHPLALSLLADVCAHRGDEPFRPEDVPDVVGALVSRFVHEVPLEEQRRALEACAVVRACTEPQLGALLGIPEDAATVGGLFAWLRGLSFIESGRFGLFPHDLAREALMADLAWRDPDALRTLVARAHAYNAERIQKDARYVTDEVFLHRRNPAVAPFLAWSEAAGHRVEAATESDVPALLDLVERHEGAASRELAAYWFARQLDNVMVVRGDGPLPAGLVAMVALDRASPEDIAADPAMRAMSSALATVGGLRPGRAAIMFRFWMARDTYQRTSPAQSVCMLVILHHELTAPHLGFSFWPCAEPEYFAEVTKYSNSPRVPEADFEIGGRRYGVYGHDWTTTTPAAWLAQMASRAGKAPPNEEARPPTATLDQAAFEAATRDALKNLGSPHALRENALVGSALVLRGLADGADPAPVLAKVLRDAAEALRATPRGKKGYRAIEATFLDPAPSQERAAEKLDLPFSTYRRHLAEGLREIALALWSEELRFRRK